ncbi:hypothetical protein KUCAC02_013261 [Chaenocephalus aceratus]|nr:hypothetical protein KUCAC02_013261 [Chaenocephalus aceratus]
MASVQEGGGSVSLPRRAETFGGFDSHQMHGSKSGDGDDSEDSAGDLRRTESDSVLKKSVLNSVSNLHLLLNTLQSRKEEYQRDLERLRDAQRKLERDREAVQRQVQKMEEVTLSETTPSTASDDSQSLEPDPQPDPPPRSRPRGKGLNPFSSSSLKGNEANKQKSLLTLCKDKKKKKKGKGGGPQAAAPPEPPLDGEIFFC